MKTKFFRKIKIVQTHGRASLLLATLLLCPIVLPAQNGVNVSGLVVNAGTVTFNVSWNKATMPVSVWSDTVWIFVDYNNAGAMKRLPLASGATLTVHTAPGVGTVTEEPGNNQGVWIVGNARAGGSFSATVKLLTTVNDVAGACVYASNYPPVGEYTSATSISFTGTPPYDLVLKHTNGSTITMQSGSTYSGLINYTVKSFNDKTGAPGIINCTVPGSTVTFVAFKPCPSAAIGDYWCLIDDRESNNVQTYKVKKMADWHIWMVQDLKFGDKCNKTSFTGSNGKDQTDKVTSLADKIYYGDCTNIKNSSTPSNRGYLYDWAAAINKSGAYYGSSSNVGCSGTYSGISGTNPGSCQGICPKGWHIPTGNTAGEFYALNNKMAGCSGNTTCWVSADGWEATIGGHFSHGLGGLVWPDYSHYHSSTKGPSNDVYTLLLSSTTVVEDPGTHTNSLLYDGYLVRCVMNY